VRERSERFAGVAHEKDGNAHAFGAGGVADDQRRGARDHRLVQEVVRIESIALQGDKQRSGCNGARVGANRHEFTGTTRQRRGRTRRERLRHPIDGPE